MTDSTAATQPAATLQFRTYAIRVAILNGLPWFYLDDVCAALRRTPEVGRIVDNVQFPQFARRTHTDPMNGEVTIVSPIGVFYLTEMIDKYGGQGLAAWARREQQRLLPEPTPGDSNVFLTILPDACLPPRPGVYSGRFREWDELCCTTEGRRALGRWPAMFAPVYEAFKEGEEAVMRGVALNEPARQLAAIGGGR